MKKIVLALITIFLCSCNIDHDTDKVIGTSFVYIAECPNLYDYLDSENSCIESNDERSYSCKKFQAMNKYLKKDKECDEKLSLEAYVHGIAVGVGLFLMSR